MKIEELLTTYWSQTTLILLTIGYFVKRIFDNKSKRIEINHSLFQKNRLETINRFFECYAKSELMWNSIEIHSILSKDSKPQEIDSIVQPVLNNLKKTSLELKIYFKPKDYKYFDELTNGIFDINAKMLSQYFDFSSDKTVIQKANDFNLFKSKALNNNNKIIEKINEKIMDVYKTKN